MPFLFLIPITLFGVWLFFSIKKQNLKIIIPQAIPKEGFLIPMGAYRYSESLLYGEGYRSFTLTNFKIFDDHFEFGKISKHQFLYSEVKDVGYLIGYYGRLTIEITFNNTDKIFYGSINKNNLREVLVFLKEKNCLLTPKAESFITTQNQ